jgi:hypothetical protein
MTPIIQRSFLFLVIAAALTISGILTNANADTLELNCHNGRNGKIVSGIKVAANGDISTREEDAWIKVDNARAKAARWHKALDSINLGRLARLDHPFGRRPYDSSYCSLERGRDGRTHRVSFRRSNLEGPGKSRAARTILRICNELQEYQPKT